MVSHSPVMLHDMLDWLGPREGGTYEALHRDVLTPMSELFALIREISGAIQHEIGAFG